MMCPRPGELSRASVGASDAHAHICRASGVGARTDAPTAPRDASSARLLTADDLARRWRVPKAHVYRLTRGHGLPVVRLGRYFRYRLAAIEAWEAAQEERSNHE